MLVALTREVASRWITNDLRSDGSKESERNSRPSGLHSTGTHFPSLCALTSGFSPVEA